MIKRPWGKGYGTESAKASIRYGFDEMKLVRISTYFDHVATIKILEKCGLKFMNTFMGEDDMIPLDPS